MRKTNTIILIGIVLIPLIWNGLQLMHYLVAHTHTFCASEHDHQHASASDCEKIYHVSTQQDNDQLSHNVEFYELKHYLSTSLNLYNQYFLTNLSSINPSFTMPYGRVLLEDIFRPPIA